MIILRSAAILAAGLCLVGCNPSTQPDSNRSSANTTVTNEPAVSGETITTASGLKYQVLKRGSGGKSPKATDTVKVHYHGTLLDGSVFDSSVVRGEPISFSLDQVIPGWTEGLQLMQVGDKFKFTIPANLAYGDIPRPKIPAGSTLVFEVELLAIE